MTMPPYWNDACTALSAADPVLARLIDVYPGEGMRHYKNPFHTLARAIVGQQISVKAADAVWGRFEALLGELSPDAFFRHDEAALKSCGLSNQKITYLGHIARGFTENTLTPDTWHGMEDEAVITQLVSIKGIGRWTAEMFLMFYLHRPDVLPVGDLGLVKAIERAYGTSIYDSKRKLKPRVTERLSAPWRPYRTVATWYLWRSLDPVPVQY